MGCLALTVYFAAPFVLFPFPPSSATSAEIAASATQYRLDYLMAAWLQGTGTLLIVVFVLGLVYQSQGWNRFAGWITMLASAAILTLSLNEGAYFIDIAQAIANGHPEATVTSFDLTFVFLHTFFIAPSLLLPLAFVLRRSIVLPRIFWPWAFAVGVSSEALGLVGLLVPNATILAIVLLVTIVVWIVSAAIALALRASS
ncbi:MAG: hypothetical protein L3J78_01340 [Thermoplasmata archaeon]|nr:hypothetical protein [Thermoplasmata archaeon]